MLNNTELRSWSKRLDQCHETINHLREIRRYLNDNECCQVQFYGAATALVQKQQFTGLYTLLDDLVGVQEELARECEHELKRMVLEI